MSLILLQKARYVILLSGTPALSRPIELFKQVYSYPMLVMNLLLYSTSCILASDIILKFMWKNSAWGVVSCCIQERSWIWEPILQGCKCFLEIFLLVLFSLLTSQSSLYGDYFVIVQFVLRAFLDVIKVQAIMKSYIIWWKLLSWFGG